jgi:hypothetical protein
MSKDAAKAFASPPGTALARRVLQVVGGAQVVLAALGAYYNIGAGFAGLGHEGLVAMPLLPWMLYAAMNLAWITCYAVLGYIGVQLARARIQFVSTLNRLLLVELCLTFGAAPVVIILSTFGLDDSVGAALVIPAGGMMFQLWSLSPLWSAVGASWARRRIERAGEETEDRVFPWERVERPGDWPLGVLLGIATALLFCFVSGFIYSARPGGAAYSTNALMALSAAAPLIGGASIPFWVWRRRRLRRRALERKWSRRFAEGKCPQCEYDLTGLTSARCPECGWVFSSHLAGAPEA